MNDDAEKELKRVLRARRLLVRLRYQINHLYGWKCPEYEENCIVCKMHWNIDLMEVELKDTEKDFREELM